MIDLTDNRVPVCLLTDEELDHLKSWPHGLEGWSWAGNRWIKAKRPVFAGPAIYCTKPAPITQPAPVTKPDPPWFMIPDEYICAAKDKNGKVFTYTEQPYTKGGFDFWLSNTIGFVEITAPNFSRGTCDWTDSLVWRPGHEPDGGDA